MEILRLQCYCSLLLLIILTTQPASTNASGSSTQKSIGAAALAGFGPNQAETLRGTDVGERRRRQVERATSAFGFQHSGHRLPKLGSLLKRQALPNLPSLPRLPSSSDCPAQKSYFPIPLLPYVICTLTQFKFSKINSNFNLARKLQLSPRIQEDPVLRESIRTSPDGITCNDVCDPKGLGFGALGLCTPDYCECNLETLEHTQQNCTSEQVFDLVSLKCEYPSKTIMCGDKDGAGKDETTPADGNGASTQESSDTSIQGGARVGNPTSSGSYAYNVDALKGKVTDAVTQVSSLVPKAPSLKPANTNLNVFG